MLLHKVVQLLRFSGFLKTEIFACSYLGIVLKFVYEFKQRYIEGTT